MEHARKQQVPKETFTSYDTTAFKEFDQKLPYDVDKNEGPSAGSNRGLKRRKTSKDTKTSKKAKSAESSKGTSKSQPKSTGKSTQAEETMFEVGDAQGPQNLGEDTEKPSRTFDDLMSILIDFNAFVMNRLQISELTQDILVGPAYNILKDTYKSYVELDYNMEVCYKALTDQLNWNNLEGDRYPFDLSKPLPLAMSGNCQIISVDYFFNNDLAYLKGGSTGRTYTTSLTKTKAAKVSKHDMYSTKRILAVTNVEVKEWYGYGHLEEIDNRLFNLKGDVIVNLAAVLRMFTRRIMIQKRVEDL
ncbi:hypothetical protein Tco_1276599 [Tanacetum coccineum]